MAAAVMSANKEKLDLNNDFENNIEYEIQLLYAMQGLKPVGVSKHFQMACVCEKLQQTTEKDVNSEAVWFHLEKLYDLHQLDEDESLPFPNDEKDFDLSDGEYEVLKQKKTESNKQLSESKQISSIISGVKNPQVQLRKSEIISSSVKDLQKSSASVVRESSSKSTDKSKRDAQPRRDSTSQQTKDATKNIKKDSSNMLRKDSNDRKSSSKSGRSANSTPTPSSKRLNDDDTRAREREEHNATPKRTTRGSLKPDDISERSSRKSQSPLTVVNSATKRRRI